MILGAGLLLLVGLGLLVGGVLTGVTALYWGCVAACLVAAVLLLLVRRQIAAERAMAAERAGAGGVEQRVAARRPPDSTYGEAVQAAAADRTGVADTDRNESRFSIAPRPLDRTPEVPLSGLPLASLPPAGPTARARETREPEVRYVEPRHTAAQAPPGEPPLEEVEVTDLLLVMDLRDEVLVIDEHPRYHLSGCPYLAGTETFALPIDEARSDGFTPCGTCSPDRNLAQRARERK